MIRVRVRGAEELERVAEALRRAPGNLRRELTQAMQDAAKPLVEDLKREIRSADVHGFRTGRLPIFTAVIPSRGLRAPMARAVEAKISTSATGATAEVQLREASIPVRIRRTVKFVIGDKGRWRHPIMGKKADGGWRGGAGQNAPNVWWKTVRPRLPRFSREVAVAVSRTEDLLRQEAGE